MEEAGNHGSDHKLDKKNSDHKLDKKGSDHRLDKKNSSSNQLTVDGMGKSGTNSSLPRIASATSMKVR